MPGFVLGSCVCRRGEDRIGLADSGVRAETNQGNRRNYLVLLERLGVDVSWLWLVEVVRVDVGIDMLQRTNQGLALALESGLVSDLRGSNLLESHIRVSLIGPDGVRSEVLSGAVDEGLLGNISNGSSLVVLWNGQSFSVLLFLDGSVLLELSSSILDGLIRLDLTLQSPGWADFEDVIDSIIALLLSVHQEASLVVVEVSLASSWEFLLLEHQFVIALEIRRLLGSQSTLGLESILDWIVVNREISRESNRVRVSFRLVEALAILECPTLVKPSQYRRAPQWSHDQSRKG